MVRGNMVGCVWCAKVRGVALHRVAKQQLSAISIFIQKHLFMIFIVDMAAGRANVRSIEPDPSIIQKRFFIFIFIFCVVIAHAAHRHMPSLKMKMK